MENYIEYNNKKINIKVFEKYVKDELRLRKIKLKDVKDMSTYFNVKEETLYCVITLNDGSEINFSHIF